MVKNTTLAELARLVEGDVEGDSSIQIFGISSIEDARVGDVTYAESSRFLNTAARSADHPRKKPAFCFRSNASAIRARAKSVPGNPSHRRDCGFVACRAKRLYSRQCDYR